MKVTVLDRSGWGRHGPYPDTRTVEIPDTCPKCGGLRGKPVQRTYAEDGQFLTVDTWENPCGHVDKYADVLNEAS